MLSTFGKTPLTGLWVPLMAAVRTWIRLAVAGGAFLTSGCAHTPPEPSRDPAPLLVGRWDGHINWSGATDWTLIVRSVERTGDGTWRGDGLLGVTQRGLARETLSITAVGRRFKIDFKRAEGAVVELWLDGPLVLNGNYRVPQNIVKDIGLTLWKVEVPVALTSEQLKAFAQYGEAKETLIGTWRGGVAGLDDNRRLLLITLVDEVEGRIRIVALWGIPGGRLGLVPARFVRAKGGLALFFVTRADVHVTLRLGPRRGVLEGTFVPSDGAGPVHEIRLAKD